jgi:3-methyladenine DNA glycosylase AlkD
MKSKRPAEAGRSDDTSLTDVIAWLKKHSTKATRDGMVRFGIPSDNALGVTMADLKIMAKRVGRSHELAAALWKTGIYEARMLTAFVDEPERVTPTQMDRWCRDFDNWAIVDTVCFQLFDRTPHAYDKVIEWSNRREEFAKRAAFALLASLALHARAGVSDAQLIASFRAISRAASDDRNFVKKGVSWALRAIGGRNVALNKAALTLARKLADSPEAAPRWIGKDALRDLTRPALQRRLATRRA